MEADMARRRRTHLPLSLEVGFEPRRGGQDALTNAYQRLLPPLLRPVHPAPAAGMREEACDATARDGLDAGAARGPGSGGALRQGVVRPAG